MRLFSRDVELYLCSLLGDWQDCQPYLLRNLDVYVSAWLDTADVMGGGDHLHPLAHDRPQQYYPVTPVRSSVGVLQAFIIQAK